MPEFKPLYRYAVEMARENNELPQWRESYAENKRCRDFLDEQINQNWDGMHLTGDIPQKAVKEFGYDRVMWVLANHLQHNDHDRRFDSDNKRWAQSIHIPRPDKEDMGRDPYPDHSADYLLRSHSVKINELADQVREWKLYDGVSLFDHRHCIPDSDFFCDYEGKTLILRADALSKKYRSPENQLFRADSGFGCDPAAVGRAVYGKFLIDGDEARFDRDDFIGVLDEQYLPDWAREKLQQEQTASDAPDEGSQPVMKGM